MTIEKKIDEERIEIRTVEGTVPCVPLTDNTNPINNG